jgi:hypothetical protein
MMDTLFSSFGIFLQVSGVAFWFGLLCFAVAMLTAPLEEDADDEPHGDVPSPIKRRW